MAASRRFIVSPEAAAHRQQQLVGAFPTVVRGENVQAIPHLAPGSFGRGREEGVDPARLAQAEQPAGLETVACRQARKLPFTGKPERAKK